jgi:hypothetical protein
MSDKVKSLDLTPRRLFLASLAGLPLLGRGAAGEEDACRGPIDQALAQYRKGVLQSEMEDRARYLKPLVERFGPKVLEEVEQVTIAEARRSMQEAPLASRGLEAVKTALWDHLGPDFEYQVVEETGEALRFRVTKCPLAARMRELGAGEIGFAYYCAYDYGFCQGLNPEIVFERTKTLMSGDDCCNHGYVLKKG